ncbi:lysophospholipase catalytic domain-containing protein [Tirmania nivea]|nr:lysophospholipase catalytic domain-containing protein [Tirmania nivea]
MSLVLLLLLCLNISSLCGLANPLGNPRCPFGLGENHSEWPSYAPVNGSCPSDITYIRSSTTGLDPNEANYISSHSKSTTGYLCPFALAAGLTASDADQIFNNDSLRPNTAIAFSGGGLRAMLNGAGVFRALDSRTSKVPEFSGLMQGMNYMAGLSGGNWLVGASALNDFASIDDLRNNHWHLDKNLVTGVRGNPKKHVDGVLKYLLRIKDQVMEKAKAGFVVTLTDFWSLALGRQLLNPSGGSNITWSQIQDTGSFQRNEMPYPISISDGRRPGQKVIEKNSTIYESTPYTFGSWDREVNYFFPMKYLGTSMQGGIPQDQNKCVTGFDVGAFIMGTSSSLFSGILTRVGKTRAEGNKYGRIWASLKGKVEKLLADALSKVKGGNEYIADKYHLLPCQYPNPFQGFPGPKSTLPNLTQNQSSLSLADGGLDNQNIPFWPLLQPARKIDFILAVDSSADTHQHWPNGSSLVNTQKRSQNLLSQYQLGDVGVVPFPYVPEVFQTWVTQELNYKPVFFGCNGSNYTAITSRNGASSTPQFAGPLILYLPNAPWSYYTNTSTFQLDYINAEILGFFDNGELQISQSPKPNDTNTNNTSPVTAEWKKCVGCAIMQRSKERANIPLGKTCKECFDRYCWGGGYPENRMLNETVVRGNGKYDPVLKDGSGRSFQSQHKFIQRERKAGVGKNHR